MSEYQLNKWKCVKCSKLNDAATRRCYSCFSFKEDVPENTFAEYQTNSTSSHDDAVRETMGPWNNRDDYVGLIFYLIVWGIPLAGMLVLTFMGAVPILLVLFYEIPAVICLVALRPWKREKTGNHEIVQYLLYGHIPDSSRTTRFIRALLPGYNIFLACSVICDLFEAK